MTAMPILAIEPDDPPMATVHDIRTAVYTVPEIAELLNLSKNGAYAAVRSGEVPARRLGHRWVIPRKAFHDWLDQTPIPANDNTLATTQNWN